MGEKRDRYDAFISDFEFAAVPSMATTVMTHTGNAITKFADNKSKFTERRQDPAMTVWSLTTRSEQ